jgi:NTP pyrophosphatase (non-canonical NTP hydrolase)
MAGSGTTGEINGKSVEERNEELNTHASSFSFNEYQRLARRTAVYPRMNDNIIYPTLGLVGEAGEVANKVKKIMRDMDGELTFDMREKLIDELGDVQWYVAMVAHELRADLGLVAARNIRKLAGRASNGTIKGSGDNR